MSDCEIHVGNAGVEFELQIIECGAIVDISASDVRKIYFAKPDGSILTKDAVFSGDGTDGKMKYTTLNGELDLDGSWRWQGYIEWTSPLKKLWTDIAQFEVEPNLP